MEIKYLGHASFRLKGKNGTLITDPFDAKMVGLSYPKGNAEVVVVSHAHDDHNQIDKVGGSGSRLEPFVIDKPGEYEINGIGVIAIRTFHDNKEGSERGENLVSVIQMDGVIIAHLGDLGHVLSDRQVEKIGPIDVLLMPVGGEVTIGPNEAVKVIEQLSPSIVVPMHYKQAAMAETFAGLVTVDEFLDKSGFEARSEDKLVVTESTLPEEMELIVLSS